MVATRVHVALPCVRLYTPTERFARTALVSERVSVAAIVALLPDGTVAGESEELNVVGTDVETGLLPSDPMLVPALFVAETLNVAPVGSPVIVAFVSVPSTVTVAPLLARTRKLVTDAPPSSPGIQVTVADVPDAVAFTDSGALGARTGQGLGAVPLANAASAEVSPLNLLASTPPTIPGIE